MTISIKAGADGLSGSIQVNGSDVLKVNADGSVDATVNYTPAGTGAVIRMVRDKLREGVSVFDFMTAAQIADAQAGTALLDCAAAFQAACTASVNVFVPAGTYKIASSITLRAGASIYGENPINTTLRYYGSGSMLVCTAGEYTSVMDVSLYGHPTSPAYFVAGQYAIEVNDSISMYNVHVRNFEIGLFSGTPGFYNKFYNCQFAFNKYALKNTGANNISFFGCRFLASDYFVTASGFDAPVSFFGCSFENVTQAVIATSSGAAIAATLDGCYVENAPTTSVTGTGLNAAGYKAAMIAYGDFKAFSLIGCGIQIMGFQRGVSTTNSNAVVVGSGNIWYYKLDGGVSDTQCLYLGGKNLSVNDRAEAWSVPTYTPATTYTIVGVLAGSATNMSGVDPISGDALLRVASGIYFPATQNLSADPNCLDDYREGTFTFTATGMTTSPAGVCKYVKSGNAVTLSIPHIAGASNSTEFTLTGLPAALIPAATRSLLVITQDNSAASQVAGANITSGGVVNLYKDANNTVFTASNTKSVNSICVTYTI